MPFINLERGRDRVAAVITAAALVGAGAAGAWWVGSRAAHEMPRTTTAPAAAAPERTTGADLEAAVGSAEITLSDEALQRVGVSFAPVASRTTAQAVRVPGTVEPNAYREVLVTPLVNGRVQEVSVQLGDRVRAGQTMATIFSPDLAAAQTRYLTLRTSLETEAARLKRTERLLEIGATSRQEYEVVRARHIELGTEVEGARAQLRLLGMPASRIDELRDSQQISSTVAVPAPSGGVIVERVANPGLNVEAGSVMFKVSDLSRVWVIASLYERNLAAVNRGDTAIITSPALGDLEFQGTVSYLDPVVDEATRTAKARIEVLNPDARLRLKMYVDVSFTSATSVRLPAVPADAVQRIGERTVVYVKNPARPGTFTERLVELGERDGDYVLVMQGLAEGEVVATTGSFHLRAQRERGQSGGSGSSNAAVPAAPPAAPAATEGAAALFEAYEEVRDLLSRDRVDGLPAAASRLGRTLAVSDPGAVPIAAALERASTLPQAREQFGLLSDRVVPIINRARLPGVQTYLCTMTKKPWAQRGEAIANPYFGQEMLACGVATTPE